MSEAKIERISPNRKELGKICEKKGIAGASLLQTCSVEELMQFAKLAQKSEYPDLPLHPVSGK